MNNILRYVLTAAVRTYYPNTQRHEIYGLYGLVVAGLVYAALASGVWQSYSEAVRHMCTETVRTYYPNTQRQEIYGRLYGLYIKYRNAMGKDYASILHELKR